MRPITTMNMTGPVTNGEFAELDDLIRHLTGIRSEMLELESSTMPANRRVAPRVPG